MKFYGGCKKQGWEREKKITNFYLKINFLENYKNELVFNEELI